MTWVFWALLSALFAAATAIFAKLGVSGVDANFATAVRTSVVVVLAWAIALATRSEGSFHVPSNRTWLFLTLSGLATGLSWVCYFKALQLGPASRVAPIDKLSVFFVIGFAALFLGETLTWGKSIGALLIVAGAIIVAVSG
jgi:transporter family protein